MIGVVEKSDLLRLAKSRTQLWECRRLNLCSSLMANSSSAAGEVSLLQLQAAMAVFRVECPAGADVLRAVRDVKDTLKRTYTRWLLKPLLNRVCSHSWCWSRQPHVMGTRCTEGSVAVVKSYVVHGLSLQLGCHLEFTCVTPSSCHDNIPCWCWCCA
jgi:hypothetical protein